MITIIVVDDEPHARAKLVRLLGEEDAEVLAVCANGEEAVAAIGELRPELVFLALARAERRLRGGAPAAEEVERLLGHLGALGRAPGVAEPAPARCHLEWLFVRRGSRAARLPVAEIDWFEAQGNYVRIHAAGSDYLIRERMTALLDRLDPRRFARIHRTAIVNLEFIQEMRPWSSSAFTVILRDGTELRLSRRYRSRLASTIGEYL